MQNKSTLQEGSLVIIYDKVSLNKLEDIVNPEGTLIWNHGAQYTVMVGEGYLLTVDKAKVKVSPSGGNHGA